MKVCFGIICIGRLYLDDFERLFKPSVSAYCQRHGYDLKIFTDFLDPSHKYPDTISFQKCLVPSFLTEYDLVVVLDADIYIQADAPPIHTLELNGKIGIVDEIAQSDPTEYQHMVNIGFAHHAKHYYKLAGLDIDTEKMLNTGLMICNPAVHATYLQSLYETHVTAAIGNPRGFHYEQACIGYRFQVDQMYTLIPNVWNFLYIHSHLTKRPVNSYFLHLAGIRGSQRENILARHTAKYGIRWGVKK